MKAVVAAFNQEKALVGAFSVIMNLRMDLFEALFCSHIMLSTTADVFQAQVLSEKTKLKQMDDDMEGILSSINSI